MARVALCDRCGAIIRDAIVKQVSFAWNPSRIVAYDVCDKCYDELEESIKIKEGRHSNDLGKRDTST